MKNRCIETDPVLMLSRERNFHIHKAKLASAGKTIDNSAPNSVRVNRTVSKSPLKVIEMDESNSRIYNKLNLIYHRPFRPGKQIACRSFTNVKRNNDKMKISSENEFLHKRLSNQKATLSFKDLQKQFNESKEMKEMISKFKRMKSSKKFVNFYNSKIHSPNPQ
jgi:hypothetical protein